MQEMLVRAEVFIKGHIGLLEQSDPDHRTQAVSVFCLQHFSNLESGIWRKRTPRCPIPDVRDRQQWIMTCEMTANVARTYRILGVVN
jgi:hypothetical protein